MVLLISFPVQMTSWLPPDELRATALSLHDTLLAIFSGHTSQGATLHELQMGVDGISQAAARRLQNRPAQRPQRWNRCYSSRCSGGALAGIGWQWVNLGFLAGGLFMLAPAQSIGKSLSACWPPSPSAPALPGGSIRRIRLRR